MGCSSTEDARHTQHSRALKPHRTPGSGAHWNPAAHVVPLLLTRLCSPLAPPHPAARAARARRSTFFIYNRPFMREFVSWALSHFIVGVWSSARQHNLQGLVQHIFGARAQALAFVWGQERCTYCGTIGGRHGKPVYIKARRTPPRTPCARYARDWPQPDTFLRPVRCARSRSSPQELQRLWDQQHFAPFGPSNTLLIDDDKYKVRRPAALLRVPRSRPSL